MKNKIIIFMLIFLTMSLGVTMGLILNYNQRQNNLDIDFFESGDINNETKNLTVKMTDMYNENSLKIEELEYKNENIEGKYYQINGLKNKEVEININKKLKEDMIGKAIKKSKEKDVAKVTFYQYLSANFGNVLSIQTSIDCELKEKDENGYAQYRSNNEFLNFKLVDGSELKFKELFVNENEILDIVRKVIYEQLVWESKWEEEYEENSWEKPVTEIDELKLIEMVNKYKDNKDNIKFFFNAKRITGKIDEDTYIGIDLEKYNYNIAIYKKFLTKESLFEDDSLGRKEIFVFCLPVYEGDLAFNIYGTKENNLFVDMKGYMWLDDERVTKEFKSQIMNMTMKKVNEDLEKLKLEAKKDKNKKIFSQEIVSSSINKKIIELTLKKQTYVMDKKQYENNFLDKLANAYRNLYSNMADYLNIDISGDTLIEKNEKIIRKRLCLKDGRELNELKDYFVDGYNYEDVFKTKLNEFWFLKFGKYLNDKELEEEFNKTKFEYSLYMEEEGTISIFNETLGYEKSEYDDSKWSQYYIKLDEFGIDKVNL